MSGKSLVYPCLQLVKLPTPAVRVVGLRNLRTGCPVCLGLFCSSVTKSSACGLASLRLCGYKTDSRPHFQNTWEESNKSTLLFLSLWLHHQIPGLTPKVELKATSIRLHKCDGQGSNLAACSTEGSKAMAPTAPQTPGTPPGLMMNTHMVGPGGGDTYSSPGPWGWPQRPPTHCRDWQPCRAR